MPESIPPEDARAVRWIVGVPAALLQLFAAACLYTAFAVRPAGPWDDGAYASIGAACVCTIAASALSAVIVAWPGHRRLPTAWWLVPPLAMSVTAAVLAAASG
ncbi:hypothetical protein [Streptodolium elevatio]|uniref:Uncharacterized protein n=1 Tax=Streptodolium elevatio TaxID=3157996 RepID=A0ABV3DTC4_9ACTN